MAGCVVHCKRKQETAAARAAGARGKAFYLLTVQPPERSRRHARRLGISLHMAASSIFSSANALGGRLLAGWVGRERCPLHLLQRWSPTKLSIARSVPFISGGDNPLENNLNGRQCPPSSLLVMILLKPSFASGVPLTVLYLAMMLTEIPNRKRSRLHLIWQ